MRVVVIGAGVVGLCCAWSLVEDGHEVVVVDQGEQDADKCSMGNSGIIVPSHFVPLAAPGMVATGLKMMARRDSPFRIKPSLDADLARWCFLFMKHCTREHVEASAPVLHELHMRSKELFKRFDHDLEGGFGLKESGMVMLCSTEEGFHEERELASRAHGLGLHAEVLEGTLACTRRIGLKTDSIGGVHYHDDAHLAPHLFVTRLRQALEDRGAAFHWRTRAKGWSAGLGALDTSGPRIEAESFVVSAGVWSGHLARALGLDLPLQPGKGMNVELTGLDEQLLVPVIAKEARIAVTPMDGMVRFGGTMELGEWDLPPDKVRSLGMLKGVRQTFPGLDVPNGLAFWSGLRPCAPDGMPLIGAFPEAENVVFATGHAMMGLSLAPVTGELVAGFIAGRGQSDPRMAPGRFS